MRIHIQYHKKHLFTINLWVVALVVFLVASAWDEHTHTLKYRYKELQPSVVKVNNLKYVGGLVTDATLVPTSLGTGTFIDEHYILTASHVVEGADGLSVEINKKVYPATLVYNSVIRDYAILFVSEYKGKPVNLGTSANLVVGDSTLILGNPLGLLYTLGFGFVSAPPNAPMGESLYYIQTWTQANPGNSGGGLFNEDNELVGVVVRHANNNFDFSVPIDEIKDTIEREIRNHQKLVKIN